MSPAPRGSGVPAPGWSRATLFDVVVDTCDDAIFTVDRAGLITSWSEASSRLFGHRAGEVVGHPVAGLFSAHLREDVRTAVGRVMAGDQIHHLQTEAVRADGLPVVVSLSVRGVEGCPSAPPGALFVIRDVTEQVLAQATLAEMERRLSDGEALAHVGSWLWDRRTGVVQWSAEFHRLHRVGPREFDGTLESYLEVMARADRCRMQVAMEAALESGLPLEETYRLAGPGGTESRIRVRAHPTIGSAGTAMGLRGVGQAIEDGR